jgi:hypothetical protein
MTTLLLLLLTLLPTFLGQAQKCPCSRPSWARTCNAPPTSYQGCQIFLDAIYQNIPNYRNITQWP